MAESSEFESASDADFGLVESEPVADLEPVPGDFGAARAADLDDEEPDTDAEPPFGSSADADAESSFEPSPAVESPADVDGVDVDGAAEPQPLVPVAQLESEPALVGAGAPSSAPSAGGSAAGPDDDLKRIEGIGPKMSAALHTAGIRTFRQLSETDEPTLRAAIQAAGLRFAPSLVTWARQARLLADGDEDGFNILTRQLIAGREARRG